MDSPSWTLSAPRNHDGFFSAVAHFGSFDGVLVLEETAMVPEVVKVAEEFALEQTFTVKRQTLFPHSSQYFVSLNAEAASAFDEVLQLYPPAAPQLCDHLSVFWNRAEVVFWPDAFEDRPIYISASAAQDSVSALADTIGASVTRFAV